ncbi:MAG: hypothetical protein ACFFBD_14920 [Candidatus Hodarchaeota archaeon]
MFPAFPKYQSRNRKHIRSPTIKHSDLIRYILADGTYKSFDQISKEIKTLISKKRMAGEYIFPIDPSGLLMQLAMLRKSGVLEEYGKLFRLKY